MTEDRTTQKILAVVGPTSTGKSAFAVRFAKEQGGEIINADSRQVYRHMNIGTAKSPVIDRAAVPHHLIDVADPDEQYGLGVYLRHARQAIEDILSRSRLPIVVGGSGQYVWALLEGWQIPEVKPDLELRAQLEAKMNSEGVRTLHEQLTLLNPDAARDIDSSNPRRVIRAIEIWRSAKHSSENPRRKPPPFGQVVLGLTLHRATLYSRIDSRVDTMIEQGFVDEVRALLERGYGLDMPSMSSIGYSEIGAHLKGRGTLDESTEEMKRRTRKLVRQQYNWFRPEDDRINWFQGTAAGFDEASNWASDELA